MDLLVKAHELSLVGRSAAFEKVQQLLHCHAVLAGEPFSSQPCRMRLEHDADLGDAGEVGDVDVGDERSPVWNRLDEVLERQALQRFADRGAPDLELPTQS